MVYVIQLRSNFIERRRSIPHVLFSTGNHESKRLQPRIGVGSDPRVSTRGSIQSNHLKFRRNAGGFDQSQAKFGVLHRWYGNSQNLRPVSPSGLKRREWQANLEWKPEAVSLRLFETENDDSRSFRREKVAYQQRDRSPSKFDLENAA